MKLLDLRERVTRTRIAYEILLANKVSDDAPLPEQHDWWRAHDDAKLVYARTDWTYQRTILRPLILAAFVLALGGVFVSGLLAAALLVTVTAVWRCYVVLTRHAPD